MKKLHGPSPYRVGPFIWFSLSLVGFALLVAASIMEMNTNTEASFNPFPTERVATIWQGTPEQKRVTEHKGTFLTLRRHQLNAAFEQYFQVSADSNSHGFGKDSLTKRDMPRVVMAGELKRQAAARYVIGTISYGPFDSRNTECARKSTALLSRSEGLDQRSKGSGSPI